MTTTTAIKLPGTPKPWLNTSIEYALRTPGIRAVLGRSLILITVVGAKTGRRYTTPVQYVAEGQHLVVLSQRKRRWWRNLTTRPEVEILLRSRTISTTARIAESYEATSAIAMCLRRKPQWAKFYGIPLDSAGEPAEDLVTQMTENFVVLLIEVH